ncbi:polysaccharide biosynthesis protein GumN [Pseudoxanthomonas suwonensis]|uniref:Polysaccharide biosynthesis protein GumN n=1 Tax=Pseudoxanthomonas suwonensis TaxID=314722 RepID=A0A0E3UQ53_9GAMM|nr:polysaccharide biosynthesis protein GumN [Pseudoxanthomonas suwonensis]
MLFAGGAQAQEGIADAAALVVDMDTVVVSGVQPGPGMWRVSKGDHVLYILGTQSPLPRDMQWEAREVREVLAEAGIVLNPPGVSIRTDAGFFRGLALAPSALKAMKSPEGATLDELLPADVYARWSGLKQRYLGRDRGVEKKRPLIAVYGLYREALKRNGLREGGVVGPVIAEALKARGMKATPTLLELKIDDPRSAIADFRKEEFKPQDLECFRDTLDIIEHGLPQVAARANAWAVGDLDALRAMPAGRRQVEACLSAWTETDTARKRGLTDIDARVMESWLAAVDKAVAEHPVSFGTVSVDDLLRADGYLAALAGRGYRIQAPDEFEEEGGAEAELAADAASP